jgi:DNA-directed RNA polymerase specialized sigma24 family protein/LysM repeat protein
MVDGAADGGYGQLYRENFRPLLGMATALIGSRAQAEEVVQDAFAATFDRYSHLADPQQFVRRGVLRGCATHKPDPDDPERPTERIMSRVRGLPRGQRDVIALRHSLGLDFPEIDRTLGLDDGTAAERAEEASATLRASLAVGDDLDHSLTTAFADTTQQLGHVLARPGDAQRRVYRRRRIRVAAGALGTLVLVAAAFFILRPDDSGEDLNTSGTEPSTSDGTTTTSLATTTTTGVTTTTTLPPTTAAELGTYTVVEGDGWLAIAGKLDVPVERLLEVNGATIEDNLFVGQELKVPPPTPAT